MRAYATMLPRLRAEERLAGIDDAAVAGGRLAEPVARAGGVTPGCGNVC